MDWNGAMEDDRRVLKRIVALLFAFANLADKLCNLPRPVRALVLWVLHSAEKIARDFVMDTALEHGMSLTPAILLIPALHGGDTSVDARRLATSFRALAVVLDRLAQGNAGHHGTRTSINRLCLKQAACSARCHQPAGTQVRRMPFCLAPAGFAIERRDSS